MSSEHLLGEDGEVGVRLEQVRRDGGRGEQEGARELRVAAVQLEHRQLVVALGVLVRQRERQPQALVRLVQVAQRLHSAAQRTGGVSAPLGHMQSRAAHWRSRTDLSAAHEGDEGHVVPDVGAHAVRVGERERALEAPQTLRVLLRVVAAHAEVAEQLGRALHACTHVMPCGHEHAIRLVELDSGAAYSPAIPMSSSRLYRCSASSGCPP